MSICNFYWSSRKFERTQHLLMWEKKVSAATDYLLSANFMNLLLNHAQVMSVRAFVKRCRKMTAFFNKSSQASGNMQLFKEGLSLFGEGTLQPAARRTLVKEGATRYRNHKMNHAHILNNGLWVHSFENILARSMGDETFDS